MPFVFQAEVGWEVKEDVAFVVGVAARTPSVADVGQDGAAKLHRHVASFHVLRGSIRPFL